MENKEQIINIIDKNVNQIEQLIAQKVNIWTEYVLFSELWWMGVALSIIPWDITLMPLGIMVLIQVKPSTNPCFKAVLLL